jgi:hypothetical protein
LTELSIDFPEFKRSHLIRPTLAKIRQNDQVQWEGPVLFNGSIAKIDLKAINGFEKHISLKIEFYKESTVKKWIDDVKDTGRIFFYNPY